jgi:hypothetical protein
MAIIDFPLSPTIGQVHTQNGLSWIWTGVTWDVYSQYPTSPIHLIYNTVTDMLNDQVNQFEKFIYYVNETESYYEKLVPSTGSLNDYRVIKSPVVEDKHITMYINTPQTIWEFAHNLSKRPAVMTFDSSNRRIYGYEEYIDENNYRVTFSSAISGYATFN